MNTKWNHDSEKLLLSLFSKNHSLSSIATSLHRSPNAVKLRIQKIIYDLFNNGTSLDVIAHSLNHPLQTISNFYHSYYKFINKKSPPRSNNTLNSLTSENQLITELVNFYKFAHKINKLIHLKKINKKHKPPRHPPSNLSDLVSLNKLFSELLRNYSLLKQLAKVKSL